MLLGYVLFSFMVLSSGTLIGLFIGAWFFPQHQPQLSPAIRELSQMLLLGSVLMGAMLYVLFAAK